MPGAEKSAKKGLKGVDNTRSQADIGVFKGLYESVCNYIRAPTPRNFAPPDTSPKPIAKKKMPAQSFTINKRAHVYGGDADVVDDVRESPNLEQENQDNVKFDKA